MMEFAVPGHETFRVCYNSNEDGGGTWFGQEYVSLIADRYGKKFDRCLEWCAGPGFIGYALYAHDLCSNLCLVDKYLPLHDSIRETNRINNCSNDVSFYCLDSLADLPDQECFDLIVANPPHYLTCPGDTNYQRLAVDTDWKAHTEFYAHIGSHMHDHSVMLIQENQAGSLGGPAEFQHMIERSKLKITAYFTSPVYYDTAGPNQIYYIEIGKQ